MNNEIPKINEREPSLVSPEDLKATIADAEKKENRWSGVLEGEFKDWWLGKKGAEGGKKLAKWVFEHLSIYRDLWEDWQEGKIPKEKVDMKGQPSFFNDVEPNLKQLISGALKYGGQEHVGQYFREEWAPGWNKDLLEKVWKIYQKYLDDIGGKV